MQLLNYSRLRNGLLRRTGLDRRINRLSSIAIDGRRFRVPVIVGHQVAYTEPWMTEVLKRILASRPGAFVDVGVNLGQTLLKVKAVDPERQYLGFEPNPACLFYLEQLIDVNALKACEIIPAALSTHSGIVPLSLFGGSTDSAASIVRDFRSQQKTRSRKNVAVLRLADIPPELIPSSVSVIKIDVEGAELEVVHELRALVERTRPYWLIEILPCYSEDNIDRLDRQQRIEEIARDLGYSIFRIRKGKAGSISFEPIQTIGIHGDLQSCDYLFAPSPEDEISS